MRTRKSARPACSRLLPLAATLLLAACGGGGGGGGSAAPAASGSDKDGTAAPVAASPSAVLGYAPGNRPLRAIPAGGATPVAAASWRAATLVGDLGSVAALTAVVRPDAPRLDLGRAMIRQVLGLGGLRFVPAGLPVTAVLDVTTPCAGGGEYIARLDDRNNDADLSTGDTLRVWFQDCVQDGMTVSGTLTADRLTIAGRSTVDAPWSLAGRFGFDAFTVRSGAEVAVAAGQVGVTAAGIGRRSLDARLLASDLTTTLGGVAQTLADYEMHLEESAGRWTQTVTGLLMHGRLGGWFPVSTRTAMSGAQGAPQPETGTVVVGAAGGLQVHLSFLPGAQGVRVDVDADGDGVPERGSTLTWPAFVAS